MAKTLNGKLITLFGGSGFLGNYVAQSLLKRGARLRIACRNPEKAYSLKPLANLGQIQFARCDITRVESVRAALAGANAAINLVGAFCGDQMKLMGEAPGMIAQIAAENGLEAFVHVSAIGADAESPAIYAQAKAQGEEAVLAAFPKATIIRPSVIFAADDNFVNMFAGLIQAMPALPVFGPEAQLQPVFADDVAEAIAAAAAEPALHGAKIYELGGPEIVTMMELHQRIAAAQGREPKLIAVPDFASALFASLPLTPLSRDQWTLLKAGNIASGDQPGFAKFGIEPRPLGLFLDRWMVRFREHGRFGLDSTTAAG